MIDIDNPGGCYAVFINELYHRAGYIAGFIINGNSAIYYIAILVSEGHCLKIHDAYRVGDDLYPAGEILRQQIQLSRQRIQPMRPPDKRVCPQNSIVKTVCYHSESTGKPYDFACCIAVFIIYGNGTSDCIDVFKSDGHYFYDDHACRTGKDHRHTDAISRQQSQLLRQRGNQERQ